MHLEAAQQRSTYTQVQSSPLASAPERRTCEQHERHANLAKTLTPLSTPGDSFAPRRPKGDLGSHLRRRRLSTPSPGPTTSVNKEILPPAKILACAFWGHFCLYLSLP